MRKKIIVVLSVALVCCLAITATAAGIYHYGDANGDGIVDGQDLTALWTKLANGDVSVEATDGCYDVNGDGVVNLKDVTLLQRYLDGGWNVDLPDKYMPLSSDLSGYKVLTTTLSEDGIMCTSFKFGESVLKRDLVCWSIHPSQYSQTILLNFAIHGWEDSYAADGQLLVNLGNDLVEYYSKSEDLKNSRLLIVPCANPDGIAEGTTNNGFGRCNADGIDLNRDFDANHVVNTTPRNYTPAPFSGAESRALRDLVLASNPDVVIDFHGWLNYTIGDNDLAEVFSLSTGLYQKNELTSAASGYFAYWAQLQGAKAILVEFKDPNSIVNNHVINAVDKLISKSYGDNQTDNNLNVDFTKYDNIIAYPIASYKVYIQSQIGNNDTSYGYIDSTTGQCTILEIYDNGWCKLKFPVESLYNTGYCLLSAFIDPNTVVEPYDAGVNETVKVSTTPSMSTHLGSVWNTDSFTVIAKKDGVAQIIYPLDSGGYKMGWIDATKIVAE